MKPEVTVERVEGKWFQARCSCGWAGSETTEAEAWVESLRHERKRCVGGVLTGYAETWAGLGMQPERALARFRDVLLSIEGIYRRRANGSLTGRNSTATGRTLDARVAEAQRLVRESDDVTDALDADARLAARWSRIERRFVGLS